MKNRLLLAFLLALFAGLHNSVAQPLAQKLESLKNDFGFEFEKLKTGSNFSEKYLLYFDQPLDHSGGTDARFTQRVFISHRSFNEPVVFVTEGYGAAHAADPSFQYELAAILEANQVCVEHRYFGESKADTLIWDYLTVENSANDLHRIAQLIRAIYPGKIVSSGISKGGQTTNFFKYFFPEDADICVPFVAPLNFSTEDKRVYKFLKNVDSDSCRKKILSYQKTMLRNKADYLKVFQKLAEKKKLTYSMGLEKAYDLTVLEYSFAFWQWGTTACDSIPDSTSGPEAMVSHLDKVANIDWVSEQGIARLQPFFYQAMHEIGMYGYDLSDFQGLTSFTKNPVFDFSFPPGTVVEFAPQLMQKVDCYLRHKAANMIFIYGENDPWSATAVQLGLHTKFFQDCEKEWQPQDKDW